MMSSWIRKVAVALFLGTVVAAAAASQDESSLPFSFSSYALRNGLHVVLSDDDSLPLVSVVLAYRVGSLQEQPGKTGLAYLLEHLMMFSGSQNVGPMQHIGYLNRIGGAPNASTTADVTYFYETVPSNQLGIVLWLESDRMRTLEIDAAKTERWKQSLLDDLSQRAIAEPYLESSLAFDRLLYPDFAHYHSILGREEDIRNLTPEDIEGFYTEFFTPNNAVLVIVGDLNLPRARDLVDKYFETIPPGKDVPPPSRPRPPEKKSAAEAYQESLAPYPAFHMGYRVAAPYTRDFYGLTILDYCLLKGKTARLYKRLIRKDRLAFYLSGGIEKRGDVATFKVFATSNTEMAADLCQKAVFSEINKLRVNLVSDDELDRAKSVFKRDYLSRFSTTLDKATYLAEMYFSPVGLERVSGELERYLSVTPLTLRELSYRFFMPDNCVVLSVKMR
jgi:zinc protease